MGCLLLSGYPGVSLKSGNASLAYSLSDWKQLFSLWMRIARTKYLMPPGTNQRPHLPSLTDQFFMSLKYYAVEAIAQSLSMKFLTPEFPYFLCQLFIFENVQYPFFEVSTVEMEIQGFCLDFLNAR
jgi:hypothetical protein